MTSHLAEYSTEASIPAGREVGANGGPLENRPSLFSAFAPALATTSALAVHLGLPNGESASPGRIYVILLFFLLISSFVLGVYVWWAGRRESWLQYRSPLAAGGVLALLIWELVTLKTAWLPLPYFPSPDWVLHALWEDQASIAVSAYHSLRLLMSGYAVGVVAGLVCGVMMGWFRRVRYWGMPLLKLLGPIPATAYVPLAMISFPNAFLSGTALIALAVWFPVTMLTTSGIANVPVAYLDVARTLGAKQGYLIFRVALPAALPSIFLGLFMGLGSAFLTLIVAETLGVSSGLGWYLKWKQGYLEYASVYAALAVMAVFFSGLMTVLFKIRDRVLSWQKGVIRW